MAQIIEFRLKQRPSRDAAIRWLADNVAGFPGRDDPEYIFSDRLFHGWRFVRGIDEIMYFANCLDPGITEDEVNTYRAKLTEISTN